MVVNGVLVVGSTGFNEHRGLRREVGIEQPDL
jgi:hypothetical protein